MGHRAVLHDLAGPLIRGTRSALGLVLGVIMLAIGGWVAIQPLTGAAPVSGSRVLDMAFAAMFLARGVMNLRTARGARSR